MFQKLFGAACLAVALIPRPSISSDAPFRPPAVPLVVCDPYFSIWSCADRLTDVPTTHWSQRTHRLTSLVRIDGRSFRVMGDEPKSLPALTQKFVDVMPTRTIYAFADAGVELTLTFTTPALPDDIALLSRPVTYVAWTMHSTDKAAHAASIYFDASSEIAVNGETQRVNGSRVEIDGLSTLRAGSEDQAVMMRTGDNTGIDWGYLFASAEKSQTLHCAITTSAHACEKFIADGTISDVDDARESRAVKEGAPVLAFVLDAGNVGQANVSRCLMLAYDEVYSADDFFSKLRPYWNKSAIGMGSLLKLSAAEYPALAARCAAFDAELMNDLRNAGGENYARMGALAYRQCWAGGMIAADAGGLPLAFSKENSGSGCMGSVDMLYAMSPQVLLFNPMLARAMLVPELDFAFVLRGSATFAPRDLGQFPRANYTAGGEMPVEETSNMLILVAAVAKAEGNADFSKKYWPMLRKWAEFVRDNGDDPVMCKSPDDFTGQLPHQTNQSIKTAIALGAWASLCEQSGENEKKEALEYRALAKNCADRWTLNAAEGDHFRMAFDRPNSWSQKYNLVWDGVLGLGLFPAEVSHKEAAFYKTKLSKFGLPLDCRRPFTKTDWTVWSACLCESRADFSEMIAPLCALLSQSPSRVPMSDYYWADDARDAGLHARPVVGGVFMRLLQDESVWRKWSQRAAKISGEWAPIPNPTRVPIVPASDRESSDWSFTTAQPAEDWATAGVNDASWQQGKSGFGTSGFPRGKINTGWRKPDIWMCREFTLSDAPLKNPRLWVHHSDDVEIYINGVFAGADHGSTPGFYALELNARGAGALKAGKNVLAVHSHHAVSEDPAFVDVGIVELLDAPRRP